MLSVQGGQQNGQGWTERVAREDGTGTKARRTPVGSAVGLTDLSAGRAAAKTGSGAAGAVP